jgi:hypothetical protein
MTRHDVIAPTLQFVAHRHSHLGTPQDAGVDQSFGRQAEDVRIQ